MVDDEEPEVSRMDAPEVYVNQPVLGASLGAVGVTPYADIAEHTGPPQVIIYTPPYESFLATDARSVMITLLPQHYNLIPNPAFRVDAAGWVATGIEPLPTSFSWRVAMTDVEAGLWAITNGTANSYVDPNPNVPTPAYVDGQLVKVVDTLAANNTVAWLKINNAGTLTVAEAAAIGITIVNPVSKYDPYTGSLSADSWVGQSAVTNGTGMLRYRAGTDKFVYVGPLKGTPGNQWDPKRGGAEYTLSVYVKGGGDVRLTMDAYNPIDRTNLDSGPEYQNLTSVASPWTYVPGPNAVIETGTGRVWTKITDPAVPTVAPYYADIGRGPALGSVQSPDFMPVENDGQWHRVTLKTRARVYENAGQVDFTGARWIDTQIEVRNANNLKISAVMLDPSEYPEGQYFDGEMTENLNLDDFIWEGTKNASVSYYYYDRVVRTKWLWEKMGYVAPAGRPYQIFFGSYWRPYVGSTGETIIMIPV